MSGLSEIPTDSDSKNVGNTPDFVVIPTLGKIDRETTFQGGRTMRPPQPELVQDPFFALVGKRISARVDGQAVRGRLVPVRDGFCTIQPDRSAAGITVSKWAITTIQEDAPRVSRSPRLSRTFWR